MNQCPPTAPVMCARFIENKAIALASSTQPSTRKQSLYARKKRFATNRETDGADGAHVCRIRVAALGHEVSCRLQNPFLKGTRIDGHRRLFRRRKVREDGDEGEGNKYAACETLRDAKENHQIERMCLSAANGKEHEQDRIHHQIFIQRKRSGEPSGQRDHDDLGDQVGRRYP